MTITYGISLPTAEPQALVASGSSSEKDSYNFPVAPPAAWFEPMSINEPHGVRIDEDGRVYGYLCSWRANHISPQFNGQTAPRSPSNYAWFHVGEVITAEGNKVSTGVLTADSYHPDIRLDPDAVISHYDNTGCGVADVRVFEDNYGIQIAGSLRPDVTLAQARMLRASDFSPDWRPVKSKGLARRSLEMVAVMACNLSGFITNALVASGGEHADGVLPEGAVSPGETVIARDGEDEVIFMCGTAWSVDSRGEMSETDTGLVVPKPVLDHIEGLESRIDFLENSLKRVMAREMLSEVGIE